jgi:hypothetical protein
MRYWANRVSPWYRNLKEASQIRRPVPSTY